jgi:ribosomal protein S17
MRDEKNHVVCLKRRISNMAKTLTGIVTSDVADKTITVTVTSRETHPIYGKQYTVNRKYMPPMMKIMTAKKGDKVTISAKFVLFKVQIIQTRSKSIQLKEITAQFN